MFDTNQIGPEQISNRYNPVLYVFRRDFEQPTSLSHRPGLTPAFRPGTTSIIKGMGFSHDAACLNKEVIKSDFTYSSRISSYNSDVIAVWANEIGPLQISNRYDLSISQKKYPIGIIGIKQKQARIKNPSQGGVDFLIRVVVICTAA